MQGTSSALRHVRLRYACALLLGTAFLGACGDNGPQTASSVSLSVPTTNLTVGQRVQITPTVKDGGGKVLTGRTIVYTTSAPLVAAVSADGQVVAMNAGAATITATVDGANGSLAFVVAPTPVDRVLVTPDTASLPAATTRQLTASPLDAAGNSLFDRTVSWSVNDTSIAAVDGNGLVSGRKAGSVVVTATIEGKSGQARLTITQAAVSRIDVSPGLSHVMEGTSTRLTAVAYDAAGRVIPGAALLWRSSNINVAIVDNTGLVSALQPGVVNILASSGAAFGGAAVYIDPLVIGSVTLSADSIRLEVAGTSQLTATVRDTLGNIVNRSVTWSTLDPAVATVSGSGLVTAVAPGRTGIVATRDNVADTTIVNVNPLPVASITISPDSGVVGLGRTGRFSAIARDSAGRISPWPIGWGVSNGAIASIDSTGTVTALTVGRTSIFASAGGRLATATLIVEATPVASVSVTPNVASLAVGDTVRLTSTARAGDSSVLANRLVTYTSMDPSIVTVDASGLVHAVAVGNSGITVSCEGQIALVTIGVH